MEKGGGESPVAKLMERGEQSGLMVLATQFIERVNNITCIQKGLRVEGGVACISLLLSVTCCIASVAKVIQSADGQTSKCSKDGGASRQGLFKTLAVRCVLISNLLYAFPRLTSRYYI